MADELLYWEDLQQAGTLEIGLLQSRWEATNQRGEIVMTMEGWGMFRRRGT